MIWYQKLYTWIFPFRMSTQQKLIFLHIDKGDIDYFDSAYQHDFWLIKTGVINKG